MEELIGLLHKIPEIERKLSELLKLQRDGKIEKIWLNVEEVAYYLGYSKHKVYKLLQDEWIEGIHYHKPSGRVIVDKNKINEWVSQASETSVNIDLLINDI